jgi:transcriptional regulator with XRE-family HTH domain
MSEEVHNPRAKRAEDKIVGGRVKKRRLQIDMSQDALGKAVGLSFQQVQKYENGHNRISVVRLLDIAKALGVTPGYLLDPESTYTPLTGNGLALEMLQCFEALDDDSRLNLLHVARRMVQANAA